MDKPTHNMNRRSLLSMLGIAPVMPFAAAAMSVKPAKTVKLSDRMNSLPWTKQWQAASETGLFLEQLRERCSDVSAGIEECDGLLSLAVFGRDRSHGKIIVWTGTWGREASWRFMPYLPYIAARDVELVEGNDDVRDAAWALERIARTVPVNSIGVSIYISDHLLAAMSEAGFSAEHPAVRGVVNGYSTLGAAATIGRLIETGALVHNGSLMTTEALTRFRRSMAWHPDGHLVAPATALFRAFAARSWTALSEGR
ncbi:hypothetical protein [Mesorhizobium sp. B2-4-6]|uniref:hypothetical protein n=1 Tax=Mesorhizobium sp. B2-4-6 TaxID=2589943 RepID=UPI001127C009|nr:hypothetical protein [Mesorhizobium sp. B2-4-6]TPL40646.1 hypothetical protein FJ957_25795 [Mesorhizobium sp. B2-4-6]